MSSDQRLCEEMMGVDSQPLCGSIITLVWYLSFLSLLMPTSSAHPYFVVIVMGQTLFLGVTSTSAPPTHSSQLSSDFFWQPSFFFH